MHGLFEYRQMVFFSWKWAAKRNSIKRTRLIQLTHHFGATLWPLPRTHTPRECASSVILFFSLVKKKKIGMGNLEDVSPEAGLSLRRKNCLKWKKCVSAKICIYFYPECIFCLFFCLALKGSGSEGIRPHTVDFWGAKTNLTSNAERKALQYESKSVWFMQDHTRPG